ncbi:MAG: PAS domain-containing protein [Magnetospirillum sp.]|nr:PAS domain-containing protein [Magnetospirillum sp.]
MHLSQKVSSPARYPRPEIKCQLLETLFGYWESLNSRAGIPEKLSFNPIDIPGLVWPRIFMIDILEGLRNYRVRLLGTYLVDAYGQDFKGCRLDDDEIPRITQSATYRLLPKLQLSGKPQYFFGTTPFRYTDSYREVEQVLMPLADSTGRIAYAVGGVDYRGFCQRQGPS